jgi:hypothetical protein
MLKEFWREISWIGNWFLFLYVVRIRPLFNDYFLGEHEKIYETAKRESKMSKKEH